MTIALANMIPLSLTERRIRGRSRLLRMAKMHIQYGPRDMLAILPSAITITARIWAI